MLKLIKPVVQNPMDTLNDLKYKINRLIDRGHYVSIYSATSADNRLVAIKILEEGYDQAALDRIKRETDVLKELKHDHILSLVNQHEDVPFLVTDLMDGDLFDLVDAVAEFGLSEQEHFQLTRNLLLEAAQALEYMHQRSYIHRDIKPENIFFRYLTFPPCSITCEVKVGDFDLATRISDTHKNLIKSHFIVGTEEYLAPESVIDRCYSRASDTYSFGLLVYFLSTQTPPYHSIASSEVVDFVLPALGKGMTLDQLTASPQQNTAIIHRISDASLQELAKYSLGPFWEKMPHDLDKLANDCCQIKPKDRSTMTQVVRELRDLTQLNAKNSTDTELNVSSQALTRSRLGFHHSATSFTLGSAECDNIRSSISSHMGV